MCKFDNQYQILTFTAELAKKSSGEGLDDDNNALKPSVEVRFRPELVSEKSGCNAKLKSCVVVLRYAAGKYYPTKVDVDPQIWGFTGLSNDTLATEKPETCTDWFPDENYQIIGLTSFYPIPFHTKSTSRVDVPIVLDAITGQLQISLGSDLFSIMQNCEVKGFLIQWSEPAAISDAWQNMYCHFDTGQCEESVKYKVTPKK